MSSLQAEHSSGSYEQSADCFMHSPKFRSASPSALNTPLHATSSSLIVLSTPPLHYIGRPLIVLSTLWNLRGVNWLFRALWNLQAGPPAVSNTLRILF